MTLDKPTPAQIVGAQAFAASILISLTRDGHLTPAEIIVVAVELAACTIVSAGFDPAQTDDMLSHYFPERVASLAASQRKLKESQT
jgi:hypothetical protein